LKNTIIASPIEYHNVFFFLESVMIVSSVISIVKEWLSLVTKKKAKKFMSKVKTIKKKILF
jgi:hypothetical protein